MSCVTRATEASSGSGRSGADRTIALVANDRMKMEIMTSVSDKPASEGRDDGKLIGPNSQYRLRYWLGRQGRARTHHSGHQSAHRAGRTDNHCPKGQHVGA